MEYQILRYARELGADLAGIADAEKLKYSPSYDLLSAVGNKVDGTYGTSGVERFEFSQWPETVKSILVIALSHPENDPQRDWFYKKGNTEGNNKLIKMNKELSKWIEKTFQVNTYLMPYYVENGGIFLKDAAVFAGLGCIGKNNLLVTPEYGPRVRLRAMLLEADLTPTGPVDFDPCNDCPEYCRKVCLQKAFDSKIRFRPGIHIAIPPARDGHFRRSKCMIQMDKGLDIFRNSVYTSAPDDFDMQQVVHSKKPVEHCRQCEFACPIGSQHKAMDSQGKVL